MLVVKKIGGELIFVGQCDVEVPEENPPPTLHIMYQPEFRFSDKQLPMELERLKYPEFCYEIALRWRGDFPPLPVIVWSEGGPHPRWLPGWLRY